MTASTQARARPSLTEAQIQAGIVRYVRLAAKPGVEIVHIPNGGSRTGGWVEGANLKRIGTVPGVPDLMILGPNGQARVLEVKRPGGQLSEAQREFLARLDLAGCEYAVVYSVEEAVAACRNWGVVQ
jgi:hypothetical protein